MSYPHTWDEKEKRPILVQDPGDYFATADKVELRVTQTGLEYAYVRFITDAGEAVTWTGFFTEKSTPWTLKTLRTIGWQGNDIFSLARMPTEDFRRVKIVVEEKEGKNKQSFLCVKWVNSLEPRGGESREKSVMTNDKLAQLQAKLQDQIKLVPAEPRPPQGVTGPAPDPNRDRSTAYAHGTSKDPNWLTNHDGLEKMESESLF